MWASGLARSTDWSDQGTAPRQETDPTRPATLYGRAKNATRDLMEALFAPSETSFAWARIFDLFGPGEARGRLIPSLVHTLRAGRPFTCRHGHLMRDYLAAEDVGVALAHLTASDVDGAINVASGTAISLGALAGTIAGQLGREDLLTIAEEPIAGQPARMCPSVTRLRQEVQCPVPGDVWHRLRRYVAVCC